MKKKLQLTPCGYRILVRVDDETLTNELDPGHKIVGEDVQTASGLFVRKLPKELEKKGACSGVVVSLGHTAFTGGDGKKFAKPWCSAGDTVYFKRYDGCNISGNLFEEPDVEYMIINDTDIWATIPKGV